MVCEFFRVRQNLRVEKNPLGKILPHVRKATGLPNRLNFHLFPMAQEFWFWQGFG
jgi:hypothetical protein